MKYNLVFIFVLSLSCWLISCSDNINLTSLKSQSDNTFLEQAETAKLYTFQYPPISNQFSGGFIPVRISYDEKSKLPIEIGFADTTGKLVTQVQKIKKVIGNLSEGMLMVEVDEDKYGFVDTTGKFAIEPKFEAWNHSWGFSEGLALVKIGGKLAFIDKKGEIAIKPEFEEASSFSEGLAFAIKEDSQAGFIGHNGEMKIPAQFDVIHGQHEPHTNYPLVFSGGRASMLEINPKGSYKVGYIDSTGKWSIYPKFGKGLRFSEGLASVLDISTGKYGYVNTKGEWIIKPQFNLANSFSEGLAVVRDRSNREGFIDAMGKVVIPFMFNYASQFSEGIAVVKVDSFWGSKWGYIDVSGRWLTSPQFDYQLGNFVEGIAVISCKTQDKRQSFILRKRNLIAKADPKYEWCSPLLPISP